MKIDVDSIQMKWILLKFLKDSLDFLCDDPSAKGTKRRNWAELWMLMNLTEEKIEQWMPKDED